jgi:choice-of-anchor C domain-containing protein
MPDRPVSRRVGFHIGAGAGIAVLTAVIVGVLAPMGTSSAFAATPSGPNLVANGCFHDPSVPEGSVALGPGSVQIPDWTIGGKGVDIVASDHWQAATGCGASVSLAGGGPGSVSQTVNTTFGDIYLLTWQMAANYSCGPVVKKMAVYWEGKLVAAPSFNMTGSGHNAMGWVTKQLTLTADDTTSVLAFSDVTPGGGACGATLDGVSLTLQSTIVNGFAASNSSDPYSVAERQMLAKLSSHFVLPTSGTPICRAQAIAAEQVDGGAGLLIIWGITPSAQFVKEVPAAQDSGAKLVQQYLAGVLQTSRNLYLAALKADRVPVEGSSNLASWWGVRVQSMSTTNLLMSFQISKSGTSSWISWDKVFGVTSIKQASAPQALANLLYYTKNVAGLPH